MQKSSHTTPIKRDSADFGLFNWGTPSIYLRLDEKSMKAKKSYLSDGSSHVSALYNVKIESHYPDNP